jgi:hypothetical protein
VTVTGTVTVHATCELEAAARVEFRTMIWNRGSRSKFQVDPHVRGLSPGVPPGALAPPLRLQVRAAAVAAVAVTPSANARKEVLSHREEC